jgi:RimJ/RimL family protein N-acetyltransferase
MVIKSNELEFKLSSKDDPEVISVSSESDDLENMSEVRMYPDGMPAEMIFKIEKGNEVIGEFRFTRLRWYNRKSELSIILKKEFQGKGYGTETMQKMIDFAFNKMNLYRLEAEVLEFNKASIKLVEKLGFQKEGVLRSAKYSRGKYWDIYRYGLLKNEWEELSQKQKH